LSQFSVCGDAAIGQTEARQVPLPKMPIFLRTVQKFRRPFDLQIKTRQPET
jgi:hypothetical protein